MLLLCVQADIVDDLYPHTNTAIPFAHAYWWFSLELACDSWMNQVGYEITGSVRYKDRMIRASQLPLNPLPFCHSVGILMQAFLSSV